MPDVTELILNDHAWFRQQFVALEDLAGPDSDDVGGEAALRAVWEPLAQRLDLHAVAEERIFYPRLLEFGADPEGETLDAISDHNDIRDAVHDAARHPLGTTAWWGAVRSARQANDEHMAEEEREGIANFRLHAPGGLRDELGRQFAGFLDTHRTTADVDTSDKDPEGYVRDVERELNSPEDAPTGGNPSLGIGSLKGTSAS